jgi:ABC-type transporter Mla subunit MlaD
MLIKPMNSENVPSNTKIEKIEANHLKKEINPLLKGWNEFVKNIKEGLEDVQNIIDAELTNKKLTENKDKFDAFFNDAKNNWDSLAKDWDDSIQKLQIESKEQWEKNKDKIQTFLKETQDQWNEKVKKWTEDLQKKQIETKQQWDEKTRKINEDIKNWQKTTQNQWEKGLKAWRREMIKGSYMFLVFMLPILFVFFIIVWLISWLMPR